MRSNPYIISLLLLLFWTCSPQPFSLPPNPYADWAKNNIGLQSKNLPSLQGTWTDRVYPLDPKRLETLIAINAIDGIDDIPKPTKDLSSWKLELAEIQKSFPIEVNGLFDSLVYGIYFVTNLGSTGLTGIVRDEDGKAIGGIIFLDSDLLGDGGNDWASKKESTAFLPSNEYSIQIHLDDSNSKESAIRFIILHELGHILSITEGHAPDFSEKQRDFRNFPLFNGIWWSETYSPYEVTFFPERNKIKFYQKTPTLSLFPEGKSIYKKLTNTGFVSLYAATNADDTYAEAFAEYIHVVILKKDYKVILSVKGSSETLLQNPITKEGGRRFRETFQTILKNPKP
ncbi:hypothetical protein EHQ68_00120 [Leptospira congkakensis]|uniref:Lipoprotein n=1 Tax=Leptospira congkakensis TaxID=2484932 RepID=A0A4Z1A2U3_9LEPT|nr:hypothetical protein [Leptospira congkakensis]TGL87807.1 hypothetical protein EHQ69_17055 [Leptospira congkakensis]TGL92584.1 hypothetical protein EHQ68_00120 [Leptospira congkakensis]TGL95958.1 hypothetical protein EHQ70_12725 [Leptospira congkakensis]